MSKENLSKNILLVEDEAIIAMNEAATLKKHGFEVITAYNAEKAIETAAGGHIDLILMDIDLGRGKMNGTEAAEIILKEKDLPIVFLTSHAEKEMVEKVKGITRYGYVLKSAGEFVLRESIAMAFELFHAHRITKESEEKYRAAFMTSPDAVNINRLDGLYVDINEGFTALTGFTREDVIGNLSSEIKIWVVPEDREKLIHGLRTKGVVENLESTFRRKDGTLTTALMSARLITINNKPHILSITRDISRRKKAEEEAYKAKQFLDNISDIAYEADLYGNVLYVNPAAEKIIGIPIKEIIGKPFKPLFIEQDHDSLMDVYGKTLKGESLENVLTFINGTTCHFTTIPKYDGEGNIIGTFGVARDITDIKQTEEAAKESEAKIKALIESTDDIIVFRGKDGEAIFYNESFKKIVKKLFNIDAYPGIRTLDYLPEEQKRYWEENISEVLKGNKKRVRFPFTFESGEKREYELTFNPIYKDGKVIGFSEMNKDITEFVRKETGFQES